MINVNMKFVRIFGKSCITSSPGLAMRHQITSIEARFISCIRCPLSPLKYNILLDFRRHLSSNVADEGNVSTNSALMKEHEAFSGSEDAGHRGLRLSKMIAETGVCSRREAEKRISEQRVSVNGRIVTDPWHRIDPGAEVWMDEYRLRLDKTYDSVRLWAVNKLRGELVADSDPIKQRPLIFDRIEQLMKQDPNLRPVTRLEFNTEGLLLLTNNGKLAKLLESSETGMERTFQVKIHGLLTESKLDGLKRGLTVKGVKYSSMDCVVDSRGNTNTWLTVRCIDYKSRQIQTCFESLYLKVLRVVCTGYGPFDLKAIPRGGFVELALPPKIQKMLYGRSGANSRVNSRNSPNPPVLGAVQASRSKPKSQSLSESFLSDEKKILLDALNSEKDIEFVNGIPFPSHSDSDQIPNAASASISSTSTDAAQNTSKLVHSSKEVKLKQSLLKILNKSAKSDLSD